MVMRFMHNKVLDKLDIRSLRMLQILLETRSVTKAGEALSIGQPAASRVLAQLRLAFEDPLLVRGRHGNALTPRAEALQPLISETLDLVANLFAKRAFDPQNTSLRLKIATTDYGAATVLVPLAQQLALSAPNLRIDIAPWNTQTLLHLEDGQLDLALYSESKLPENFHHRSLFRDKYACLVRQGHPLSEQMRGDGSLDPRAAALFPQTVMLYPEGDRLTSDDVLSRLGHPAKRIVMSTPYFTSAPLLVSGTDTLILLPSRLGDILAKSAPVALIALHADTEFEYRLIWHERTQRDQGRSWIRTQIYSLFSTQRRSSVLEPSRRGRKPAGRKGSAL
jgi:DNA-binding transcriptional LysR family regulator